MALVRILVDGHSLLNSWPALAPGKPPVSVAAREELLNRLTQYYDACGTPISIVFDGMLGPRAPRESASSPEVEVVYYRPGQTAHQMIERLAHRLRPLGEVLVVTDDAAERGAVAAQGGQAVSGPEFVQTVERTLAELGQQIASFNQQERRKFNQAA